MPATELGRLDDSFIAKLFLCSKNAFGVLNNIALPVPSAAGNTVVPAEDSEFIELNPGGTPLGTDSEFVELDPGGTLQ